MKNTQVRRENKIKITSTKTFIDSNTHRQLQCQTQTHTHTHIDIKIWAWDDSNNPDWVEKKKIDNKLCTWNHNVIKTFHLFININQKSEHIAKT